jgi:hypothetical protein
MLLKKSVARSECATIESRGPAIRIAARNAAAMAFISVAVSVAFVSMSDGSCHRNAAQPKLIAINISRNVIV